MITVLFACVHNAGRSQMAAAWFNLLADPKRARGLSAGTQPGMKVHPLVVEVMNEVGVHLANVKPQLLTKEVAQQSSLLVTMGCGEACPVIPGLLREDWSLPDPKDSTLVEVRALRDEIRRRIESLITAQRW